MTANPSTFPRTARPEPDRSDLAYRSLIALARDPVAIVSLGSALAQAHLLGGHRGTVIATNAAFSDLLGGDPSGLGTERFAPAGLGDALDASGTTPRIATWRRLDGSALEVSWGLAPIPGEPLLGLLTAREHHAAVFGEATRALRDGEPAFSTAGALWIGPHGEIAAMDDAMARLLGAGSRAIGGSGDGSELVGSYVVQVELGLSTQAWNERVRRLEDAPLRLFTRLARVDGTMLDVEILAGAVRLGGHTWIVELARDVRGERALRSAYEDLSARFDLVSQAANDGLWVWDLVSGEVEFSPRWAALVGLVEARLVGAVDLWLERIHPSDRPTVDEALGAHLDGISDLFESEHRIEHRSGTWRWVLVRAQADRDGDGNLRRMAGSMSDITQRKNAEERLRYEAFHDPLTGLANRAWFIHRLQDALHHAEGPAREDDLSDHFAVVLIGVDGFKLVNDSFGPSLGDMLLRAIAARIARSVRSVDTVARIGGDEFVVLFEGLETADQIDLVAERISRDLSQPFDLRGYAVYSSVSMGIVPSEAGYSEPEDLLRDANIALVRAKRSGRGRRLTFDQSMRHDTIRRLLLETDLRRALERAELRLAYQPIVSLQDGEILGFEALARWHHSKHGLIGPSEFIPLAEESGLIVPIGHWALVTACEEALSWPANLWVAVNVSGRQLTQPGFVDEVRAVLTQVGLDPHRLHLEITESVLMDNAEASRDVLDRLRELGIGLSIDDFGTGYSSLAYLRRFPIETLKIDRAFLAKDANTEDSWAIIETIRSLAGILGIGVVVEGVETQEHVDRLRRMGCQAAQGYLIARPIADEEVDRFLTAHGTHLAVSGA
ncbi:MAG: EAL domain-containing protein [Deltaproteobacteria bacterium]|nr:EAL domain-containing protein [Deltaproteobacteria bacterium]